VSAISSRILLAPPLAAYAYDAVWTLAVALNSSGLPSIDASGMESSGAVKQTLTRGELQRISFVGITVCCHTRPLPLLVNGYIISTVLTSVRVKDLTGKGLKILPVKGL